MDANTVFSDLIDAVLAGDFDNAESVLSVLRQRSESGLQAPDDPRLRRAAVQIGHRNVQNNTF